MCKSTKLNIVQAKTNYATKYSDTRKSSPPIKIVDKTRNTPTKAVVNGDSIRVVIAAMPYFKDGKVSLKQAWRCLLDSESDGNLIFIKEKGLCNIPNVKRYIPLIYSSRKPPERA